MPSLSNPISESSTSIVTVLTPGGMRLRIEPDNLPAPVREALQEGDKAQAIRALSNMTRCPCRIETTTSMECAPSS